MKGRAERRIKRMKEKIQEKNKLSESLALLHQEFDHQRNRQNKILAFLGKSVDVRS